MFKNKITKQEWKKEIVDILLILLGCVFLALGSALFIVPFNIIQGGMTSIAELINLPIQKATGNNVTDLFVWGFNVLLWILGLVVLGKDFAFNTLFGSIFYPVFLSLFMRLDLVDRIGLMSFYQGGDSLSRLILLGIAGGVLSGIGTALTYLGHGTSGGSDVLFCITAKYTDLTEDVAGFIFDSSVIFLSLFVIRDWGIFLVGILAAFACSMTVKNLYTNRQKNYRVEIITDKKDEIKDFLQQQFHSTCTLSKVYGGYTNEEKDKVTVLLNYHDTKVFRSVIASLDPKALTSIDEVSEVKGGPFTPAHVNRKEAKKIREKFGILLNKKKEEEKKED